MEFEEHTNTAFQGKYSKVNVDVNHHASISVFLLFPPQNFSDDGGSTAPCIFSLHLSNMLSPRPCLSLRQA